MKHPRNSKNNIKVAAFSHWLQPKKKKTKYSTKHNSTPWLIKRVSSQSRGDNFSTQVNWGENTRFKHFEYRFYLFFFFCLDYKVSLTLDNHQTRIKLYHQNTTKKNENSFSATAHLTKISFDKQLTRNQSYAEAISTLKIKTWALNFLSETWVSTSLYGFFENCKIWLLSMGSFWRRFG